jgi:hypothetical protein
MALALDAKSGWVVVPEDDPTHRFAGDAIFQNDRLLVVLPHGSNGAVACLRTAQGPSPRMKLCPLSAGGKLPTGPATIRILENNPGAVMLRATFTAVGGTCAAAYRLAAGQPIAEVRAAEGASGLFVGDPLTVGLIVPDFFGNDMVFLGNAAGARPLKLPAENFFLALSRGTHGEGIVAMCVWPSRRQRASAIRGPSSGFGSFHGYEIEAARDKSIWVAVLEGAGTWHEQAVSAEDAKRDLTLAWKPPFPAKWRADLVAEDGPTLSWYFHKPEEAGDSPPVCSLEGDRAVVRLQRDPRAAPSAWHYPAKLIVYAMDRDRATPLDVFCPMDVLRNTLGVGPCQYILQTEGLGAEATPDSVMTWVEKQFRGKKEKKAAAEIREQLDAMVAHVRQAQARIGEYGRLAGEVRGLCAGNATELDRIAAGLQQTAAATEKPSPADRTAELAAQVAALIGKADALAECQRLGAAVRAIGVAQDAALANCRMAVRWLRQSAAMIAEDNPQQAELAKTVQARAEKFLAGTEKQGR